MSAQGSVPPPRLELRGITKRFPGVLANDSVDLRVAPGEIHALLGENGAGKSTLVKMIYGILHPDSGEMLWDGKPLRARDPHAARGMGIGMVFQHFSLFEAMTVLENVALALEKPERRDVLATRIREVSRAYGLPLDPHREVHTLSVGERQRIEIVRCLIQSPKLLIMDEPTSVLTPQEADRLFETLRLLAAEGCSILYISHKLAEIKALCHRATVLRGGRVVGACDPGAESAGSMAQMMIGSQIRALPRRADAPAGAVRLAVDDLALAAESAHGVALRKIAFEVRGGEIFGVAGVAGNGQNELLLALSGERAAPHPSAVTIDAIPAGRRGAAGRRALGLSCVPEERNGHGAVADYTLVENGLLSAHDRLHLSFGGMVRASRAAAFAQRVVSEFDVRTTGVQSAAASLSGGNLQKFIVGREILQQPGVLVVSQPTWGVDAGAAAAIHAALLGLAAQGSAIVVISQDLDELLTLSDRLAVLNVGVLSPAMARADVSVEQLGLLMGGMHGAEPVPETPIVAEVAYAYQG